MYREIVFMHPPLTIQLLYFTSVTKLLRNERSRIPTGLGSEEFKIDLLRRLAARLWGTETNVIMGDVKVFVDQKIAGKKVMVFSKTHCPFCTKAKKTLEKYLGKELSQEDYEVLEIENMPNCGAIQDYLQKVTGGRSVPRVFVNQKFIGGGDDVVAMDNSGKLKALLA